MRRTPKILTSPVAQIILAAAGNREAFPDGFTTREPIPGLAEYSKAYVAKVVARLMAVHALVSVRPETGKGRGFANYFTDVREADKFRARLRPTVLPAVAAKTTASERRAPWAPGTEAVYPTDENGNPLYKVTIGPSPARSLRTNTHGGSY